MDHVASAIVHLDMDAFYASVEQRDRPELRGRPVIVGGHPRRGVVLAASYEVRPFGVASAMPMARALALVPHAVVVPPRPEAYAEASAAVFAILDSATPLVEPLSLDEAFLDVSASISLLGPPAVIARDLRGRIRRELDLPASAGIASVKMVAKIASDMAKPDGQREVLPSETKAFLAPLPVGRLWGVGPKTRAVLESLGLATIGDLAAAEREVLHAKLGALGDHLHDLARGIDPRPVVPDRAAKSIGAEDTFDEDITSMAELRARVHAQALRVGFRLRRAGVLARVVHLKVKLDDFTIVTRQRTFAEPTDDGQALYRAAVVLLDRLRPSRPVRLTGVSAQDLVSKAAGDDSSTAKQATQLSFPTAPSSSSSSPSSSAYPRTDLPADERRARLNAALDRIGAKFGHDAITTADVAVTQAPPQGPAAIERVARERIRSRHQGSK